MTQSSHKVTLAESVDLFNSSYGSSVKIKRSWLLGLAVSVCLITFGTNWLIPFLPKLIKKDIRWRY